MNATIAAYYNMGATFVAKMGAEAIRDLLAGVCGTCKGFAASKHFIKRGSRRNSDSSMVVGRLPVLPPEFGMVSGGRFAASDLKSLSPRDQPQQHLISTARCAQHLVRNMLQEAVGALMTTAVGRLSAQTPAKIASRSPERKTGTFRRTCWASA